MRAEVNLPPTPRGLPLVGSLFDFRRDPVAFMARVHALGDVVRVPVASETLYVLFHPDHVREVFVTRQHDFIKGRGIQWMKRFLGEGLLTSEGAFHTRQRRLVQPAFHRQRVGSYAAIMAEYAARARERWTDGVVIDMSAEMMALTLAVVARALFDTDVEGEAREIGDALTDIIALFPRFQLPLGELVNRLPLPSNRRFDRASRALDAVVYRLIDERRREGTDHGDLLSMLLLSTDTEGDGGGMDDRQLRDEVMTLLMAGHETTANALTWTFYLLSQNPEAEARLHAEVDGVLQGRLPALDDVPALACAERVFAESMRLYPPVPGLGRRALRDVPLGGWTIPAHTVVVTSPFVTHRDPRFWPDPLRFDPDRFTPEARAARPRFAYFPFGGGARNCIGEPFAWLEGVVLLATIAQRWRFRLVEGHPVVPQALITLRPRYGMKMVPERRA